MHLACLADCGLVNSPRLLRR